MFEFESRGSFDELRALETELCEYLGFGTQHEFAYKEYDELAEHYGTDDLTNAHEKQMQNDFSHVTFLQHFPRRTSPFWNMKKIGEHANKIDVILYGAETIGSAERSTNPQEMRDLFYTISDGGYAGTLFAAFGRERVEKELNEFLELPFFPRFGGGIGMTRMMQALAAQTQNA